jgi:hypothetical protein
MSFPSIEPTRREYDLGDFPMEEEVPWPGVGVRFRTGFDPLAVEGLTLTLTFEDLRETQMQQIRTHYNSRQGGTVPFTLPAVIWRGDSFPPAPLGTRWRYLAPPEENQKAGGWFDVTVPLEAQAFVPPQVIEILIPTAQTVITGNAPAVGGAGVAVPTVQTIVTAPIPTISTAGAVVEPQSVQTIVTAPVPTVASDGGGGIVEAPTTATTVDAPIPAVATDGGGGIVDALTTATAVTGPVPTVDSGGTANPPLAATYSQVSVYSSNTAATAPVMTNSSTAEDSQTGTNSHTTGDLAWVQMDFGAETAFEKVVVGADFYNTLAGGWGKFYAESADIIGSNNGTTWTVLGNTGTFTDGIKVITTTAASYRYVRIRRSGFLAVTEFYALAT